MEKIQGTLRNIGQKSLCGETVSEPCPYCGKLLERQYLVLLGKTIFGPLEICDCPEGKKAAEKAEAERTARKKEEARRELESRQRGSGLSINQLHQTFETFKVDAGNKEAFSAAMEFVEKFKPRRPDDLFGDDMPLNLMLMGKAGVGKTHLASAIVNRLIEAGNYVTFRTVPELLSELKRTYSYDDGDEYVVMQSLKRTVLLVLDDLGKEQQTEWSLSKLYEIINFRYENYMPVVVTSNYSTTGLYEHLCSGGDKNTAMAIVSRLTGMCKTVGILGADRRMHEP